MRRWLLISAALLCASPPCLAQNAVRESEPVVFMRGALSILPAPPASGQGQDPAGEKTQKPRSPHRFFVDVKAAEALEAQDFYSKNAIAPGESRLFVLEEPAPYRLTRTAMYAPVDILMVALDGTIAKIARAAIAKAEAK